jgi:Ca-activated chloride channel family protein
MTFDRVWMLIFLVLPVAWTATEWRRTARHLPLILKACSLLAIVIALAEPRLAVSETKMGVGVLIDTSASAAQDLSRASQLAANINAARGRNTTRVLPFARTVQTASAKLESTAGDAGHGTDLEAAVREGISSLPAGQVPRLVLISDGKENSGTVTRAAWQARSLGIPIDTIALPGRQQAGLRLESVSAPEMAFTGDRFPIDLVVDSPTAVEASIEIAAEGKPLGSQTVMLQPGENHVQVHTALTAAGAINLSAVIKAAGLGSVRFDQALNMRRPRVLFVSRDPEGTEKHLLDTLAAAQFDIDRTNDPLHGRLADYQVAVLNNWDLESLPADRKNDLDKFVKHGGGLLVIGGENNVYSDLKKSEDPLDRALPAKLAPPRSPEGTTVVLIIDKSSSMEGKKIELARLAAIGVIENLRPIDSVGVLIFDNSFQWAVPIRRAEDKALLKRLVSGITPDGGTQIAPALNEAYRKILPAHATFKHIVLLTDGISEEGDSLDLSKDALAQHVTISTVGLGQDVNRAYLEKIANLAGGKAYFLNEPTGLEQILLKDVMEHTGSTAIEKTLKPIVNRKAEVLDNTGIESAPALKGYVKFEAKPTSDTVLMIDEKEPLYTRWQYGLGRSAVFTSDAKSRWAADWVTWKGFDKLWTNIFRDLLPHSQEGEAQVEYDSAAGDLVIHYTLSRELDEPGKIPEVFVLGPDHFQHTVEVSKVADRVFRGRVHVGERQGLFRIRPLQELRGFPEVGYYVPEQELLDHGSNEFLLREIASYTGGRFNPSAAQVFDTGGRSQPSSMRLWPFFLAAAIAFNLGELILRKGRALVR